MKKHIQTTKQFLLGALVALVLLSLFILMPTGSWLSLIVVILTILLTIQGYLVTRSMLFGFSHRDSPIIPSQTPTNTFSLIIPARNEPEVIGHTILSLSAIKYPKDLYEVLVIIRADYLSY